MHVPALTFFLSESPAALIAQLKEEGFDPAKMRLPPEQWFRAADGLQSVRALIAHVSANLNNFKQSNPILRDLKAAEALLTALNDHRLLLAARHDIGEAEMSVRSFLEFIADLRHLQGDQRRKRMDYVIGRLQLERVLEQTIETLSKGFRRRVGR